MKAWVEAKTSLTGHDVGQPDVDGLIFKDIDDKYCDFYSVRTRAG